MMRRVLALMLCLASAWLLYGLAIELFIAWYSGSEWEASSVYWCWTNYGLQVAVDAVAMLAGWRWFRQSPRTIA